MGANEKRSLSVSAMSIFLMILLQLVFNTSRIRATTSLPVQFNFNNNSSTTYHCNGSVHECLIMDGIESELIFMDSVHTSRMLASAPESTSQAAVNHPDQSAGRGECGRAGVAYTPCLQPNPPKPKPGCERSDYYRCPL